MTLSSKHGLDDLEKWVRSKFEAVKNQNTIVPKLNEVAPYPANRLSKLARFVPVADKDILKFFWILPNYEKEHKSKPLDYFSHLIGHEGENSLLSYLISEGLALELSAGGDHEMSAFSTFEVNITLTEKGMENYESVIEAVF